MGQNYRDGNMDLADLADASSIPTLLRLLRVLRALLQEGADACVRVRSQSGGRIVTPLVLAAQTGGLAVIRALLAAGGGRTSWRPARPARRPSR